MIITIAGDAGSGKSTVAELVARKLKFRHYSVGDFMRTIAKKRNSSLLQLSKMAETDETIDEELDCMQKELGRRERRFVLDSRLGWHFVPNSFKVFLKVDIKEGAKRIFNAGRKGEKENRTLRATVEKHKKKEGIRAAKIQKILQFKPIRQQKL